MAAGDIIIPNNTITPEIMQKIAAEIIKQINTNTKDPGQWEVVESTNGVTSLPVLQVMGATYKLVRVAISTLQGVNGREVELQMNAEKTAIQWRYVAVAGSDLQPTEWKTLIDVSLLKGDPGETPEFRQGGAGLEWKYKSESDDAWRVLVSIEVLKLKFSDLTEDNIAEFWRGVPADVMAEFQKPAQNAADELNKIKAVFEEFSKTTVLAEYNRVKAEEQRVTIEKLRVEAEKARASAESLREDAEELRDQSETERADAEAARKEAESSRVLVEGLRVDEESKRAATELVRIQSEQSRVTEEGKRVEAEEARVTAETLRDKSETERDKAEGLRDQAESARASEEVDRDTAEQERIMKEAERIEAEKLRITSETKRSEKEDGRIVEEQLRVNAENARKEAEANRVTAEEEREQDMAQAILDAEEATDNAKTAAKRAYNAAAGAENIVKGFQSDWNVSDPADPNYIRNKPEIPTLDTIPGTDTISYLNSTGTTVNFRIGDEVRVLEDGEYIFYRLYDLVDGVASWQESGSGMALLGNIYLQGADYYNDSIIRIKEGYINE